MADGAMVRGIAVFRRTDLRTVCLRSQDSDAYRVVVAHVWKGERYHRARPEQHQGDRAGHQRKAPEERQHRKQDVSAKPPPVSSSAYRWCLPV